jgi:hypothetical protein
MQNTDSVLLNQTMEAFKKSPERLFIAERLYRFGSVVIEPLEELLETSSHNMDGELQFLKDLPERSWRIRIFSDCIDGQS